MSESQAIDFTSRMNAMTEEIGDTAALDSAFEGLSDSAQGYALKALADPSQRVALIETMPISDLEELADVLDDDIAAGEIAVYSHWRRHFVLP